MVEVILSLPQVAATEFGNKDEEDSSNERIETTESLVIDYGYLPARAVLNGEGQQQLSAPLDSISKSFYETLESTQALFDVESGSTTTMGSNGAQTEEVDSAESERRRLLRHKMKSFCETFPTNNPRKKKRLRKLLAKTFSFGTLSSSSLSSTVPKHVGSKNLGPSQHSASTSSSSNSDEGQEAKLAAMVSGLTTLGSDEQMGTLLSSSTSSLNQTRDRHGGDGDERTIVTTRYSFQNDGGVEVTQLGNEKINGKESKKRRDSRREKAEANVSLGVSSKLSFVSDTLAALVSATSKTPLLTTTLSEAIENVASPSASSDRSTENAALVASNTDNDESQQKIPVKENESDLGESRQDSPRLKRAPSSPSKRVIVTEFDYEDGPLDLREPSRSLDICELETSRAKNGENPHLDQQSDCSSQRRRDSSIRINKILARTFSDCPSETDDLSPEHEGNSKKAPEDSSVLVTLSESHTRDTDFVTSDVLRSLTDVPIGNATLRDSADAAADYPAEDQVKASNTDVKQRSSSDLLRTWSSSLFRRAQSTPATRTGRKSAKGTAKKEHVRPGSSGKDVFSLQSKPKPVRNADMELAKISVPAPDVKNKIEDSKYETQISLSVLTADDKMASGGEVASKVGSETPKSESTKSKTKFSANYWGSRSASDVDYSRDTLSDSSHVKEVFVSQSDDTIPTSPSRKQDGPFMWFRPEKYHAKSMSMHMSSSDDASSFIPREFTSTSYSRGSQSIETLSCTSSSTGQIPHDYSLVDNGSAANGRILSKHQSLEYEALSPAYEGRKPIMSMPTLPIEDFAAPSLEEDNQDKDAVVGSETVASRKVHQLGDAAISDVDSTASDCDSDKNEGVDQFRFSFSLGPLKIKYVSKKGR